MCLTFSYVFPTHVGVYLRSVRRRHATHGFPHACGGVPVERNDLILHFSFSPRMWGCTGKWNTLQGDEFVFPTHVGVYRTPSPSTLRTPRFPHACGGVPMYWKFPDILTKFSPRMWGCTDRSRVLSHHGTVFPTHVGVYRSLLFVFHRDSCFPHACGGVPLDTVVLWLLHLFSPRMWGCTSDCSFSSMLNSVFPTHVGVYREAVLRIELFKRFPHACGGVPAQPIFSIRLILFSPRMWGCTGKELQFRTPQEVFPTHVGVYLTVNV